MTRSRLVLFDANVVIWLFRLGIWDRVIEQCDVYVSETIIDEEAHFYLTEDEQRRDLDLHPYVEAGRITSFAVTMSRVAAFGAQFDPVYLEKLDPGETESLAFLLDQADPFRLCSADKIVFRVLGDLNLGEAGISLQELLGTIGLGRALPRHFTKAYREQWTKHGAQERIQERGIRKPPTDRH